MQSTSLQVLKLQSTSLQSRLFDDGVSGYIIMVGNNDHRGTADVWVMVARDFIMEQHRAFFLLVNIISTTN